ncbi:hypothetical protein G5S34_22555 [Herbaspirillum frisingense]|uniref:hypothetical protein n=1 Tax=Herbaspirillum frisingense TaxID=92645 RepID=UPI0015FF91E7|nr:hypothetical protein [Herbaspirillum frisingense]QNB09257.1 hypothetical protein G5S34_22555 [Herbaspirillum frisingense]
MKIKFLLLFVSSCLFSQAALAFSYTFVENPEARKNCPLPVLDRWGPVNIADQVSDERPDIKLANNPVELRSLIASLKEEEASGSLAMYYGLRADAAGWGATGPSSFKNTSQPHALSELAECFLKYATVAIKAPQTAPAQSANKPSTKNVRAPQDNSAERERQDREDRLRRFIEGQERVAAVITDEGVKRNDVPSKNQITYLKPSPECAKLSYDDEGHQVITNVCNVRVTFGYCHSEKQEENDITLCKASESTFSRTKRNYITQGGVIAPGESHAKRPTKVSRAMFLVICKQGQPLIESFNTNPITSNSRAKYTCWDFSNNVK